MTHTNFILKDSLHHSLLNKNYINTLPTNFSSDFTTRVIIILKGEDIVNIVTY